MRFYKEKIAFSIFLIPPRALTCHQGNLWLILRAVNEGVNEWLSIQTQTLYNPTNLSRLEKYFHRFYHFPSSQKSMLQTSWRKKEEKNKKSKTDDHLVMWLWKGGGWWKGSPELRLLSSSPYSQFRLPSSLYTLHTIIHHTLDIVDYTREIRYIWWQIWRCHVSPFPLSSQFWRRLPRIAF